MMKKIAASAIVAAALAGCVGMQHTAEVYRVAKGVYQVGKKIVVINEDLIGEDAMVKLRAIDEYAGRFDTAVGIVGKGAAVAGSSAVAGRSESDTSAGGE